MTKTAALEAYLSKVLGQPVRLQAWRGPELPLYLSQSYQLGRLRIHGADLVLAEFAHSDGAAPPSRLAADWAALRTALATDRVVLVLPGLAAYLRNRLVAAHVPFIVPGRQLYLPMLWIDLRESFDAAPQTAGPWLGWSAQLVLLRHLLRGDVEDRPLVGVAGDCGYSAMTLSKARRELIAAGLAVKGAGKRPKPLCFAAPPAELWERALPLLRSPVAKVHPVARLAPGLHPQSAGTTALADQTALAPDPLPTAALSLPAFRRGLTDRTLTLAPGWDEAALRIEAWKYDPQRLSEGGAVDPLSLYLCLRLDPDERVQAALEGLVATVRW